MLFNLLLANKSIFLCLFFSAFIFCVFKDILAVPLVVRNTRLILALTFPTGVPIKVVNKKRETSLVALLTKQVKSCQHKGVL